MTIAASLLHDLPDNPKAREAEQMALRLNQELSRYTSVTPELRKIREYHKAVPHISSNGMIRLNSPAASGGICMHTHPGYDDPYEALPSDNDLLIIASQAGALPFAEHVGGGETQGEHYIMHIPRKYFFDEVQQIVDRESVTDDNGIIQVKQEVLNRRIDDIMEDEILGFKIDGTKRNRLAVLSPVVAQREYERHSSDLQARGVEGWPFEVKDLIFDIGVGYVPYTSEVKSRLAERIGKFRDMKDDSQNEKAQ